MLTMFRNSQCDLFLRTPSMSGNHRGDRSYPSATIFSWTHLPIQNDRFLTAHFSLRKELGRVLLRPRISSILHWNRHYWPREKLPNVPKLLSGSRAWAGKWTTILSWILLRIEPVPDSGFAQPTLPDTWRSLMSAEMQVSILWVSSPDEWFEVTTFRRGCNWH